jgi:hypothetical protein
MSPSLSVTKCYKRYKESAGTAGVICGTCLWPLVILFPEVALLVTFYEDDIWIF